MSGYQVPHWLHLIWTESKLAYMLMGTRTAWWGSFVMCPGEAPCFWVEIPLVCRECAERWRQTGQLSQSVSLDRCWGAGNSLALHTWLALLTCTVRCWSCQVSEEACEVSGEQVIKEPAFVCSHRARTKGHLYTQSRKPSPGVAEGSEDWV